MRDLFRPIKKDSNNQSIEYNQKEAISSCVYSSIDNFIGYQEDEIYDLYYQDYRDQSEWEALMQEIEIMGLLII